MRKWLRNWRHMSENKVFGWLGLARKAGKLVAGDALCEEAITRRRARLVVMATDAGPNTRERFETMCAKARVDLLPFGTKEELGHRLGRDTYAVVAVLDRSFADQIRRCTDGGNNENGNLAHGGGTVE